MHLKLGDRYRPSFITQETERVMKGHDDEPQSQSTHGVTSKCNLIKMRGCERLMMNENRTVVRTGDVLRGAGL